MTFLTECAARDHQGMTTSAVRVTLFIAAFVFAVAPLGAVAHEEHEFEPLSEVLALQRGRPAGPMLFFALPDDFETASPYALVPAGRPIVWVPDATDLLEGATTVPPMRAIGSPPPDPANARYLVPVLDGAGASLHFAPRRLEAGRLVEGAGPTGANAVPVLVGPQLPVNASSTEPVLDKPVQVDAAQLVDVTPALLVRRAPPSRVVFGIRLASGDYVPLVDESGIALSARRDGRLGIAVAAPANVDVSSVAPDDDDDGDGDSSPSGVGLLIVFALLAAGAAVVIAGVVFLVRFALRRLNRRGGR